MEIPGAFFSFFPTARYSGSEVLRGKRRRKKMEIQTMKLSEFDRKLVLEDGKIAALARIIKAN